MINYMVDTTGEVFEPTVISSAGPKSFESNLKGDKRE